MEPRRGMTRSAAQVRDCMLIRSSCDGGCRENNAGVPAKVRLPTLAAHAHFDDCSIRLLQ